MEKESRKFFILKLIYYINNDLTSFLHGFCKNNHRTLQTRCFFENLRFLNLFLDVLQNKNTIKYMHSLLLRLAFIHKKSKNFKSLSFLIPDFLKFIEI